MKSFHLNLGKSFAQPFESSYAQLRRCLIVNPGIPLSAIEINLRNMATNGGSSLLDRLHSLQASSDENQSETGLDRYSFHRQCPKCAEQLYHSDIYALSWLTHCPIHHIKLTTKCPACSKPWPDIHDLAERNCRICGMLSLEQLKEYVIPRIQKTDYEPIEKIYKFINYSDNDHFLDGYNFNRVAGTIENRWWRTLSVSSPLFPGCQVHCHPDYSPNKLKQLQIALRPVHRKRASLIPVKENYFNKKKRHLESIFPTINQNSMKKFRSDFNVMRNILALIYRQTGGSHQVHIVSYRHIDLKNIVDGPIICPYCTALSLWFFDTAAKRYGQSYADRINDYPFCWQSGFDHFLEACEPYISTSRHNYYITDQSFATWFYRRGLEISFLDILRFAFYLRENANGYLRDERQHHIYTPLSLSYIEREFSDRICSTHIDDGVLELFYENQYPLEVFEPPIIKKLDSQCRTYHRYHESNYDRIVSFNFQIPTRKFTYRTFLELHRQFRNYLVNGLYRYGRWSTAMN